MKNQSQKASSSTTEATTSTEKLSKVSKILELEEKFLNYEGIDRVIGSDEAQGIIDSTPENPINYKTGFPTLDDYIERIEGGEMLVVSGLTKNGKTTFCQSLTKELYDRNIFSLWFSYEMPTRQLLRKFPKETFFYLPNQLYDKDLKWIENRIYEAKLKYNVNVVFIDHLHFLIDLMARNSSWEIGRVVREIKKVAVKHNVVIFLITHVRKTKLDVGQVPDIDDLRDSSFIAQDSDGVFFITRMAEKDGFDKIYNNETMLTVAVHRESGTMQKNIPLIFKNQRLYEKEFKREESKSNQNNPGLFGYAS